MTKQTFIKGAMILLAAGIINRILGFIPRIALPRIIGAEGVGLYQLGYPFLIVMLTLITGGIPLAVAKWVAEAESAGNSARSRQIFRTALALTVLLALLFTGLLLLFAPWITTHILTDKRVYHTFLLMSPMLLISAISAVLRGYFQGKQNMIPTAFSQVLESLFRIVFMLIFAQMMLPWGLEWAAAGAMLGVVIGELSGLLILLWQYIKESGRPFPKLQKLNRANSSAQVPILKRLVSLSLPVTGSKLVGSLSYLLESILTARCLAAAGIATAAATAQYGALQGMIIPILLLPTALTYSLAVSLVPSLSEAAAQNDKAAIQKRLQQSMRIALVFGAPFVVFMWLFAEPLCKLLYNHVEIAPMLRWMAPVGLFVYLQAPLQAALQALDKPGTALLNTFIGAAIKLILIVQLASDPSFGIYGAIIAINVNIVVVTLLHGWSVLKFIGFRMKLPDIIKVLAAMPIVGACSLWMMKQQWLGRVWLDMASACLAGTVLYIALMALLGLIGREELGQMPIIGRWVRR